MEEPGGWCREGGEMGMGEEDKMGKIGGQGGRRGRDGDNFKDRPPAKAPKDSICQQDGLKYCRMKKKAGMCAHTCTPSHQMHTLVNKLLRRASDHERRCR